MDLHNIAAFIESRATEPQDYTCFLDSETGEAVSYFELRLRAVWLARELEAQGVVRGGWCAVDMDNCPAFFYALVAAIYGGFTLVLLNTRLTEEEKQERIAELKHSAGLKSLPLLDEATALALCQQADSADATSRNLVGAWARRGVGSFDELARAAVLFTSGTSGKPKAAQLCWRNLVGAALASNARLNRSGEGIWQLALPAYHVGGLSIFFRSVLNRNAFVLYRRFDPQTILADAYTYGATHISLVDKMLQDLVAADQLAEEQGAEFEQDGQAAAVREKTVSPGDNLVNASAADAVAGPNPAHEYRTRCARLADYECILLGGAQPNAATLIRALGAGAAVCCSFGMTETASQAASAPVMDPENVLLDPLGGYEFNIVAPDQDGYGQLAVRGPGVFDGYLNARAAFTVDGFFLTGDRACMVDGRIRVAERSEDMFVSGGENVYPVEIRDKILGVEGVSDAYVFGAPDDSWGRRPVAFVETAEIAVRPGFNAFYFADDMRNRLATRLSPLYMPDQFVVLGALPRTSLGKLARSTMERSYEKRIQVEKVEVWHLRLPLASPIRTAKQKLRERETILVRVSDFAGRTGIGECPAFSTDWYLPETIEADLPFIRNMLAPLLVGRVLLRPEYAAELFENAPRSAEHPFACAALENALWDLYGKIRHRSIRQLIGGRENAEEEGSLHNIPEGRVFGGVVLGIDSPEAVLAGAKKAVDAGYARVKLKIKPGNDVKAVELVRKAYPRLQIMLDANQSYKESQLDVFRELDQYDIACIEEPLDPTARPTVGPTDLFDRLARLQASLRMRVCLDESWTSGEHLQQALDAHPELRCVALKIAKFGGLAPAMEFYAWARERGIEVWPGGMYDTGVSKRLHAALSLLPGVNLVGDISDSANYFTEDVCDPPFALQRGTLLVNDADHPYGLGCDLDTEVLERVSLGRWVVE